MISIIIPVLNEIESIERLLIHLTENSSERHISDIIVVDGGSNDGTQDAVLQFSESSNLSIKLLTSERGRAKQMNLGAKKSKGDTLYFLHADSRPPNGFDRLILSEIAKGNKGGCFRMKFDSAHPLLQFSQWFTRFNFKVCRGGDQSLFVSKDLFVKLNGFNEQYAIYEDCEFINRLYDHCSFSIIPDYVVTSSRKYHRIGAWKLQYHFAVIHMKHRLGYKPQALHNYYRRYIA
jgi:rSAM/selenodomain-associated transferase 2